MTPDPAATVYVVDDDPAVCRGLDRLLRSAGYSVRVFQSAPEFLADPRDQAPSCAILDILMPGMDGPTLQESLLPEHRLMPVIFLSGHADVTTSVRVMKRGATDLLLKPVEDRTLLAAVEAALAASREAWAEQRADARLQERLAILTPREREVMAKVMTGALNKQIAGDLGIAEKTVKIHRGQVMHKLRVDSVAELVRLFGSMVHRPHGGGRT
jgi:FixJ family two-component response regulator